MFRQWQRSVSYQYPHISSWSSPFNEFFKQSSAQTGAVSTLVHTGRGCYKLVQLLLIQMWLSLRSQCAWEQCCDQKQRTGSHQCWPVWVAVQHGRAGKLRQGEPSLAAGCTLSPADQQLPSGAPRNRKPGQPSEDGSAPDRLEYKTTIWINLKFYCLQFSIIYRRNYLIERLSFIW